MRLPSTHTHFLSLPPISLRSPLRPRPLPRRPQRPLFLRRRRPGIIADSSEWDEFGDSDAKLDDELDPGSWRPIFEPDSAPIEPTTAEVVQYYNGVLIMISAVRLGDPVVMEAAATEFEASAAGGNPHAQSALGFLYQMGMMRERNRGKAFMYHYFAAEGGNVQSRMALAYTYSRQDMYDKAVKLYAELAEIAVNSFFDFKGLTSD